MAVSVGRAVGWVAGVVVLAMGMPVQGENWPHWRGPRYNGVSSETGLPERWSAEQNILWRVPLPGPGGATPVVWEDRIFLTSADGDNVVLLGISTDGKILWKRVLSEENHTYRVDEGNDASPSPTTDGRFVWAATSSGDLACFTCDGEPVWRLDLNERYGPIQVQYGWSSSPLLHEGRLYIQLIHGPMNRVPADNALVLCLDAATGKEIWKQFRFSDAIMENKHSYASPILYQDDHRTFLLTHGADYIVAHRLEDGEDIWYCGGLNPPDRYNPFLRFVASPAVAPGYIVVPSAKRGPVLCLKPDGQGNITDKPQYYHWKLDRGTPDVPSPLIHDGLVYLCSENGDITCVDAASGELVYSVRAPQRRRHRASPVYADGKVFFTSRDGGVITVVRAGRRYEVLAQNRMEEPISASLAISNGRIYIRTFEALYAVGRGPGETGQQ